MSQSYKTITLDDRAAYVELQTAILDHLIKLGREVRIREAAGENSDRERREFAAAVRASDAVMGAQ